MAWPQDTPSFKVAVDMVNILATVRDEQGRLVNSLTKEDFILEEEGQPQEIEYFSSETDFPLTLGLLVDTSMSQRRILEEERQASYQFLEDILRPESDLAFVMSFDVEAQLLENLTNSQQQLLAALENLQVPTRTDRSGAGTVLYALLRSRNEHGISRSCWRWRKGWKSQKASASGRGKDPGSLGARDRWQHVRGDYGAVAGRDFSKD